MEIPECGHPQLRSEYLEDLDMKLNWNSQMGGGLRESPFCGGGMDIF